jgi:hypothetical protein
VIIKLGLWVDHSRQINHLRAWRCFGEGQGLWVRVKRVLLPNGDEMPLHEELVYFLQGELVTTARLYDALPADVRRVG